MTQETLTNTKVFSSSRFQVLARVVENGDSYGLNDCLTHEGAPMIEFYDHGYANTSGFGPRGQFISRYFLDQMEGRDGLNLEGGVPKWTLDSDPFVSIISWANETVGN